MSRLVHLLIGVVLAVAVVLPVPSAGAAGETEIVALGTQFLPQVAELPAGSGVVWVNREPANYPFVVGSHNIIPDGDVGLMPGTAPFPASSPLLAPGEQWSCRSGPSGLTCPNIDGKPVVIGPGRYAYVCGVHPNQMHGLLVVP